MGWDGGELCSIHSNRGFFSDDVYNAGNTPCVTPWTQRNSLCATPRKPHNTPLTAPSHNRCAPRMQMPNRFKLAAENGDQWCISYKRWHGVTSSGCSHQKPEMLSHQVVMEWEAFTERRLWCASASAARWRELASPLHKVSRELGHGLGTFVILCTLV